MFTRVAALNVAKRSRFASTVAEAAIPKEKFKVLIVGGGVLFRLLLLLV